VEPKSLRVIDSLWHEKATRAFAEWVVDRSPEADHELRRMCHARKVQVADHQPLAGRPAPSRRCFG